MRFDGDGESAVTLEWVGSALRVRTDRPGLGATSAVLRNGQLDAFTRFVVAGSENGAEDTNGDASPGASSGPARE